MVICCDLFVVEVCDFGVVVYEGCMLVIDWFVRVFELVEEQIELYVCFEQFVGVGVFGDVLCECGCQFFVDVVVEDEVGDVGGQGVQYMFLYIVVEKF